MPSEATLTNDLLPGVSGEAVEPSTRARGWERLGAGMGIVFVALQLGLGAVLTDAPALDAPEKEIHSYLVEHGGNVLLAATLGALSAFFFVWFLGTLRTFLRTVEGARGHLSAIAFGAGLVTITLATTASLPTVALAWDDTARLAEPGLVRAVWNLNTLALVPVGSSAGAFCLAAAIMILRTRVIPAWVGWIGILASVMGVLAVFFLAFDDPGSPLGTPVNLGGFLLAMVFILLLSIFLVIRLGKTESLQAMDEGPR